MPASIMNPDADWAPYLDDIRYLYLEKKWALPRVRNHMRENRGLNATLKQYKGLFKKLKMRKNMTFAQWTSIHQQLQERSSKGKESMVFFQGNALDDAHVRRELKRYKNRLETIPQTFVPPQNSQITIRTPSPDSFSRLSTINDKFQSTTLPILHSRYLARGRESDGAIGDNLICDRSGPHWETMSLDVPVDAMSEVDWSDIATQPRKLWLYGLPTIILQKRQWLLGILQSLGLFEQADAAPDDYSSCVCSSNHQCVIHVECTRARSKLFQQPICRWSWDALRSILGSFNLQQSRRLLSWVPLRTNLTSIVESCSETDLLIMVISAFINGILGRYTASRCWLSRQENDLMAWLIERNHYQVVYKCLKNDISLQEIFICFARCLALVIAKYLSHRSRPQRQGIGFETDEKSLSIIPNIDLEMAVSSSLNVLDDAKRPLHASEATQILAGIGSCGNTTLVKRLLTHGAGFHKLDFSASGRRSLFDQALKHRRIGMIRTLLEPSANFELSSHLLDIDISRKHSIISAREHFAHTTSNENTSKDIDMGIIDDLFNEDWTIFTYTDFCIFRSPSLCYTLHIHSEMFRDSIMLQVILAAIEDRNASVDEFGFEIEMALYGAAEFGNIQLVQKLLQTGVNPECPMSADYIRSYTGTSTCPQEAPSVVYHPLEHAFRNRDALMAGLLLDAGAVASKGACEGFLSLDSHTISFMRDIAGKLNQLETYACRNMLLLVAIHDGDKDQIEHLISIGANANHHYRLALPEQRDISTPLLYALRYCPQDMVCFLWSKGARFTGSSSELGSLELCVVCNYDVLHRFDKVAFLAASGACPKKSCQLTSGQSIPVARFPPLWWLTTNVTSFMSTEQEQRLVQCMGFLLDNGAEIDWEDSVSETRHPMTPLALACYNDNESIARYLLHQGAKAGGIVSQAEEPLVWAVQNGNMSLARLLMEYGALGSGRPLGAACQEGYLKMVQLLVENGADVNFVAENTESALATACRWGRLEVAKVLVELGADIHYAGRWGTPLQLACLVSSTGIIKYLVELGVDVNEAPPDKGLTALQWGATNGDVEAVLILLEAGADINKLSGKQSCPFSGTAIEIAAGHGRYDMVKLLINAGAEEQSERGRFKKAINIAEAKAHDHIVKLLKEQAAMSERRVNAGFDWQLSMSFEKDT